MTVIEFFDGVSIHNMVSCLTMKPDKVIFIGERKLMQADEKAYTNFVKQHEIDVKFEFKSIQRNSLDQIIDVLEEIVKAEESCIFDLTGGDDLVLVAMGIVYERHKGDSKILMHRFNIKSGSLADCDNDGFVPQAEQPQISVADNIMLYGGRVVPHTGDEGTYHWDFNEEFTADLLKMWDICKANPAHWNSHVNTIAQMIRNASPEALDISVDRAQVESEMKYSQKKYTWAIGFIKELQRIGIISNLNETQTTTAFTFKNEQIKECLTKAGNLLELVITYYARIARDNKNTPVYNDIVTGVVIDWDAVKEDAQETTNEIDVLLMKGLVPIFISCKNGMVDQDELYKLNTVAEEFGGPYAKKVLVCTYFGNDESLAHDYFMQRAKDMNIRVIPSVHEMPEEKLVNILGSL